MITAPEVPLPVGALRLDQDTQPDAVIPQLLAWATERRPRQIGYPVATDVDFTAVQPLFNVLLNNIGDPRQPCSFNNSQQVERAVITWCADLFGLPPTDRWGYVSTGGTESNIAGVHAGLRRYPNAVIYRTRAAHYSAGKIAQLVGRSPTEVVIEVDQSGEMNYDHFTAMVRRYRRRPALVVATAGTTMTEAHDDTGRIAAILDHARVPGRHIHVDAALSGIPLALDGNLQFTPDAGIDSLTFSGHKWLGTPIPCAVFLMRNSAGHAGTHVAYTDTYDTTIAGSRSGQAAALLWYAIATIAHRPGGHRQRVADARQVAAYAQQRLTAIGWDATRHPHAVTVVIATPPSTMVTDRRWILATENDITHIICTPGVTPAIIDTFVTDLTEVTTSDHRRHDHHRDDRTKPDAQPDSPTNTPVPDDRPSGRRRLRRGISDGTAA